MAQPRRDRRGLGFVILGVAAFAAAAGAAYYLHLTQRLWIDEKAPPKRKSVVVVLGQVGA
jgi:hypothetical protein